MPRTFRSSTSAAPGANTLLGVFLAALAVPWTLHGGAVALSALGAHPLGSRGAALSLVVAAALAAGALGRAGGGVEPPAEPRDSGPLPRAAALACALLTAAAGAVLAVVVSAGTLLPVVAYDALAYRLPTIAAWLDEGRIAWVPTDDPVRNGYPLGQEAVSAVISAASGSLRLVGATSLPYIAAGALSIWLLAENLGVRRPLARAAGALFVLCPMTILNAPSGYSDASFAGATIALSCSAGLLARSRTAIHAVATGMAAALVLSLKGTGLPFVLVTAVVLSLCLFRAPVRVPAVAAALALPGAFWAVRNCVHTGNPLYPVQIRLGSRTLTGIGPVEKVLDVAHNTPGELRSVGEVGRVLRTWLEWRGPATECDDRLSGLGWAWVAFAVPAILLLVVRVLRERGASELLPASIVVLLTGVFFVIQPMKWWSRYTLWVWGAGGVALAVGAERLARARFRGLPALLSALAVLSVGEAAHAAARANGLGRAIRAAGLSAELASPRRGANAAHWVDPAFFRLGWETRPDVCRGFWKPATDNANLDGVFAQLTPRPRVHVVFDDRPDWPAVLRDWAKTGCRDLLLLEGSPVIPAAFSDPSVAVKPAIAFDRLYIVRARGAEAPLPSSGSER